MLMPFLLLNIMNYLIEVIFSIFFDNWSNLKNFLVSSVNGLHSTIQLFLEHNHLVPLWEQFETLERLLLVYFIHCYDKKIFQAFLETGWSLHFFYIHPLKLVNHHDYSMVTINVMNKLNSSSYRSSIWRNSSSRNLFMKFSCVEFNWEYAYYLVTPWIRQKP